VESQLGFYESSSFIEDNDTTTEEEEKEESGEESSEEEESKGNSPATSSSGDEDFKWYNWRDRDNIFFTISTGAKNSYRAGEEVFNCYGRRNN
jgi:hypothetical protein